MILFVTLLPLLLVPTLILLAVPLARPHASRFRRWFLPALVVLALLATLSLVLGGTPAPLGILSVLLLWLVVLGKGYQDLHAHPSRSE
jgi:hypothetical protein